MATRLWCIRHGEVEAPYVGAFVGRTDVALSDLGRHQAKAVAAYLSDAPIDVVVTSPRTRARQTSDPLAEALEMDVEVWDGFAEMDFGAWEGRHWPDIEAADPAFAGRWQADPEGLPCPDGESAGGFARRVEAELARLLEAHEGQTVALFAHAGVNRAVLARAIGIPYMQSFALAQDYGCVNALEWHAEAAQVALLNLVPGPMSRHNGDGGRTVPEATV